MPLFIKKTGSIITLSVVATSLVSSLSLSIIYFFGSGVLQARETTIEIPHIIDKLDELNIVQKSCEMKMDNILTIINDTRTALAVQRAESDFYEMRIEKCEQQNELFNEHIKKGE